MDGSTTTTYPCAFRAEQAELRIFARGEYEHGPARVDSGRRVCDGSTIVILLMVENFRMLQWWFFSTGRCLV